MHDLEALLAQKADLDKRIDAAKKSAREEAIARVKSMMSEYGLTAADLNIREPLRKAAKPSGAKVPAKYRDTATGQTWSGRGLQPKWLRAALATGRKIEDFRV